MFHAQIFIIAKVALYHFLCVHMCVFVNLFLNSVIYVGNSVIYVFFSLRKIPIFCTLVFISVQWLLLASNISCEFTILFINSDNAWKVPTLGVLWYAFGLNTERYGVFSPNARKYGPAKLRIQALSTQWRCYLCLNSVVSVPTELCYFLFRYYYLFMYALFIMCKKSSFSAYIAIFMIALIEIFL